MSEPILHFIDLETTGVDTNKADILQIGCVSYNHARENFSITYNGLVNPGTPIPADASALHGITDEKVRYSPSIKMALVALYHTIMAASKAGPVYVAAYNGEHYDFKILSRFGMDFVHRIDIMRLAARVYGMNGLKLGEAYKTATHKEPVDAHDAVADCLMTMEIAHTFMMEEGIGPSGLMEYMSIPQPYTIMPFGKYKGMSVEEVPKSYFRWCQDNFTDCSPDLLETFKLYA